jgi:hypothetical protein
LLPFPKRPNGPNEYDLQTGDYVAYDARSQPTRQPLWGRSTPPPGYGGSVQVAPHVRADMRMYGAPPPSAPASIAPVAMSAYPGTGSYPAQPTVVVRGRPDMRWGVTLALAGALLGGVLGVTMNNGKHRASAATEAVAPPQQAQMVAAAQPVQAPQPISTAVVVPTQPVTQPVAVAQPAAVPQQPAQPAALPAQPAGNTVAAANPFAIPPGQQPATPQPALAVNAPKPPAQPQPAVAATPKPPQPAQPTHATRHAPPPPVKHAPAPQRSMVAAAVPPPAKASGGGTDEMKLLREATKESDNSLGGSH